MDEEILLRQIDSRRLHLPVALQDQTKAENVRLKILVAEDSSDDALLLERAFNKAAIGAEVAYVTDGSQAIERLKTRDAGGRLPDLLLLDLKMPNTSGFEVLEWLRLNPEYAEVKVIILSGSDQSCDMIRARELGARHYLIKPHRPEQLVRMVKGLDTLWRNLSPQTLGS